MSFGKILKSLCEKHLISYNELSILINKPVKTIKNYELGIESPDTVTIIKLADYFSVTTDYLLGINRIPEDENLTIEELLSEIDKLNDEIVNLTFKISQLNNQNTELKIESVSLKHRNEFLEQIKLELEEKNKVLSKTYSETIRRNIDGKS